MWFVKVYALIIDIPRQLFPLLVQISIEFIVTAKIYNRQKSEGVF